MKTIVQIIFLLTLSINLFAQKSDSEIIDLLKSKFQLTEYDRPSNIIQFNADTILVAGYLGNLSSDTPRYQQNINVVYKTIDGGKNWSVVNFDGNAWIYTSVHLPSGKIWLGGSDNYIHYSEDFGEKWVRKKEPFFPIDRVLSIYMVNDSLGIAGGLSNGLAITYDNWETTTQLQTPIDQNKFRILQSSARDRIDKIAMIDSLILINQNEYFYYSKLNPISWQEFKVPVANFAIDKQKNEIILSSRNGKRFVIDTRLDLIRSFSVNDEDFLSLPSTNDTFELDKFFEKPIKMIKIESKEYVPDDSKHFCTYVARKENKETAEISLKNDLYIFKAKNYKSFDVEFNFDNFKSMLLNGNNKSLNQHKEKFIFFDEDFDCYQKIVENQIKEFDEREEYGGNPTIMLKPQEIANYRATEMDAIIKTVNIEDLFLKNSNWIMGMLILLGEKENIEFTFINRSNEELKISNDKSIFLSLPWTISYKNQTTVFYGPELTYELRKLIPSEFMNYNMLLGGELIYKIYEQDITNKIEY
ncbi:glycoside hydrolase [Odoribacter sp. OttesenSCG-928-J03]|nr:glycoside hydrolase [Odoribacter sp. OttesenSCG-928-J03]